MHSVKRTSRELWNSLEKKYKTENAGSKKFVVCQFLDYKTVDSETDQSGLGNPSNPAKDLSWKDDVVWAFHVTCMIEKMSLGWKDIKNNFQHKRKPMTMEDLSVKLALRRPIRLLKGSTEHLCSQGQCCGAWPVFRYKDQSRKRKGKEVKLGPRCGIAKKPKFRLHWSILFMPWLGCYPTSKWEIYSKRKGGVPSPLARYNLQVPGNQQIE